MSSKRPLGLATLCSGLDQEFFHLNGEGENIFSLFEATQAEMPVDGMEERLAFHYQRHFLPDFVATHTDRASMQESLEVRSPFLSPEIVTFANRLPAKLKRNGSTMKVLLRRVLERQGFPENLLRQKKQGFTFPVARALKTDLKPLMIDLLSNQELYDGLLSRNQANHLVEQHITGKCNNYRILFNLMAFAAWQRKFPQIS